VRLMGLEIMTTKEKQGRRIHDIIPIQGREDSFSNEGSGNFPFHVEVPHYNRYNRPDFVAFLCLRGLANAETLFIDTRELEACVSRELMALLRQPLFKIKHGVSFGDEKYTVTEIAHKDGIWTVDLAEMIGVNEDGEAALAGLKEIISRTPSIIQSVTLRTGDFFIFDNLHFLHARKSWKEEVKYDGSQRWLKRVYLKKPR